MRDARRLLRWSGALLTLLALETLLSAAAFNVFFSTPDSPDIEPLPATYPAYADRLVVIQIDGLRRDHAFNPELMPNLCRLKDEGSGGQCLTPEVVMTAICVRTMWTGVSPDIMSIVTNWDARTADDDNFWRQADAANMTLAMVGDDSLGNQFGAWADYNRKELDHGIYNINMSDDRTWEVSGELLANRSYDVVDLHFAGIDHAGHAYTLDSPQYRAKCAQMDVFIGEVAENLHTNDTLMIVVDHAQTDAGLHGYGDYESRDGVIVLWGKGVANRHVDVETKDVAATTCALMGLPMPVAGEGIPRVDMLNATDEEKARILLYAARGRARYLAAYESENDVDLPGFDALVENAESRYESGDWNGSRAASEAAIATMNEAYYESRTTEVFSVAPLLLASVVLLSVGAVVLVKGERSDSQSWLPAVLLAASGVVLAVGLAEFTLGVAGSPLVQHPAWRWGVGFGTLAVSLCAAAAGVAALAEVPSRWPIGKAASGAFIFVTASAFWLVLMTVLLHDLKEWPLWSLALLGLAMAGVLALVAFFAYRYWKRIESSGWGWLPPFALACLLAGMFVKALMVLGVVAVVAWYAWRVVVSLRNGRLPVVASAYAVVGLCCTLLLAYLAVPAMAYEHITHWSHTNLDKWPLWLGFVSVIASLAVVAVWSRARDDLAFMGTRSFALAAIVPLTMLALAHHLVPDGHVVLLDWVARVVLAGGIFLVVLGAVMRSKGLVLLSAFVLFALMASGGQMVAFSALMIASTSIVGTFGVSNDGIENRGWNIFGKSALLLAALYTSFYALGYTLAFTSVDIRASTIGLTELNIPYAVVVIVLKYALPVLVIAVCASEAGTHMRAAFLAAFAFLVVRIVVIMAMLETGVMDFQLIIAFTGEILFNLLWTMGAAFFVGWVFQAFARSGTETD